MKTAKSSAYGPIKTTVLDFGLTNSDMTSHKDGDIFIDAAVSTPRTRATRRIDSKQKYLKKIMNQTQKVQKSKNSV